MIFQYEDRKDKLSKIKHTAETITACLTVISTAIYTIKLAKEMIDVWKDKPTEEEDKENLIVEVTS